MAYRYGHHFQQTENNILCRDAVEVIKKMRGGILDKTVNVLLLGEPGVGKSTLINSMIMALNTFGHSECARKGQYDFGGLEGKAAYTQELKCISTADKLFKKDQGISAVNFWDFPGLPNSIDEHLCCVIALLLDGRLPPGTKYKDLQKYSASQLTRKFGTPDEGRVIHVVMYLHAATSPVQENLVRAVGAVARDSSREVPVFLIVTKMDLVRNSKEEADIEKDVGYMLPRMGLLGSEEKLFKLTLYCNEVTSKMRRVHELDEALVEVWNRLLDPSYVEARQVPVTIVIEPEVIERQIIKYEPVYVDRYVEKKNDTCVLQ